MREQKPGAALLGAVSRLIRLLEQETSMLQAMRPDEVESLQEEKSALVADYQEQLSSLGEPSEALAGLKPAIRQELSAAAVVLQSAIEENARALTAAKLATDQLVHSIASAVLEEQRVQEQYRADGRSGVAAPTTAPVAVSLNEVL